MTLSRPDLDTRLSVNRRMIEEFAKRNGIRRLGFFGSVLGSEFDAASDVDVLVEFLPGRVPGLLRLAELELELSELIGRKVDLNTPGFLHPRFRDSVIASAMVYFEAA